MTAHRFSAEPQPGQREASTGDAATRNHVGPANAFEVGAAGRRGVSFDVDERAPTERWLQPIFMGLPIPPHSADLPLPNPAIIGSTDATRLERTRRMP